MGTILTLSPPVAELPLVSGAMRTLASACAFSADELRRFGGACVGESGPELSVPAPLAPAAPAGRRALSLGGLEP